MSYCLNPACSHPNNPPQTQVCQSCGSNLLLRDRYQATQVLGKGGFGATFLAEDVSLPGCPTCVIKQLLPATDDPELLSMARQLFEREAKTLGKIGNHPQLPRLLDYFEQAQEFFLVQDYVSGPTLQQEVKQSGKLDQAAVLTALNELLPILDYCHTQGVIHRDIKPANIIRRSFDHKLVLIDFGAVKDQVQQTLMAQSTDTTLTAFAIGTPGFSPPEQMAQRPVYASDIYALGVTCIFLLTGKAPKDLNYDPATGELLWRDQVEISSALMGVLEKMLEASVRQRFQSAQEVLQALADSKGSTPAGSASRRQRLSGSLRGAAPRPQSSSPGSYDAIRGTRQPMNSPRSQASRFNQTRNRESSLNQPTDSKALEAVKLNAASLKAAYREGKREFTEVDLSRLNLQKCNLSGAIFHQAKLHHTNLQGANLFNANFGRASFKGAKLGQANLSKAYLSYADLSDVDLQDADLSDAYLRGANLQGANLGGANLTEAKITNAQLALARTNRATIFPDGKRGTWWKL